MRVRKPAYSGMCDFQTELSSTFGTSDVYVKQTINNNIENIQSEARPNSDSSKNSQQTKRKHINMGDFLHLSVSNSQNEVVCFEKKFPKDITIVDLKSKLEVISGGCASTMQLQLYNGDTLIGQLSNDDAMLGSYPIENDMRIHVVDNFQLFDKNVEKFELTETQYEQKRNTVRDYLKSNKLGKYNAEEMAAIEERKKQDEEEQQRKADSINIGDRCLVTAKGPRRIGCVKYKGPLDGKPGIFVGVQFDEPLGMHDGSVNGKRYFECPPKYGSMIPVMSVEVGDYPPEDYDLDEEI